jgi:hypothetical protein
VVKLRVGMMPTLARKIPLPERLITQIICLLFRQLDNRLKAHKYASNRGKGTTYVYA